MADQHERLVDNAFADFDKPADYTRQELLDVSVHILTALIKAGGDDIANAAFYQLIDTAVEEAENLIRKVNEKTS